jgi:hypothetical protein
LHISHIKITDLRNYPEEIQRMSTPPKVSVVLSNTNDWDEWIEVVKVHALAEEVWEYVAPSKDQVPTLKEPRCPGRKM